MGVFRIAIALLCSWQLQGTADATPAAPPPRGEQRVTGPEDGLDGLQQAERYLDLASRAARAGDREAEFRYLLRVGRLLPEAAPATVHGHRRRAAVGPGVPPRDPLRSASVRLPLPPRLPLRRRVVGALKAGRPLRARRMIERGLRRRPHAARLRALLALVAAGMNDLPEVLLQVAWWRRRYGDVSAEALLERCRRLLGRAARSRPSSPSLPRSRGK